MKVKGFQTIGKKIIAIGKNYADHAKEMNSSVPSKPLFFLKPTSSYINIGQPIILPQQSQEIHHEVELAVVIKDNCKTVNAKNAYRHIAGYAIALDMTARDLQREASKAGLPWTMAKGFNTFTPISKLILKEKIKDPHNLRIWCDVDGEIRQDGKTSDMIFKIPYLIEYISSIMSLNQGDVILTGTPAGVGPVVHGQKITIGISEIDKPDIYVAKFPIIRPKPKEIKNKPQ